MPKGKKQALPPNYMDFLFVPAPGVDFTVEEGLVVYTMEHRGFFPWLAQTFFRRPKTSRIRMDEHGSALWLALDGKNTVYDVVRVMEQTFPDEREDMLKRVVSFLRVLQSHKLVVQQELS